MNELKCSVCGKVLPEGSSFCKYCGNKIPEQIKNAAVDASASAKVCKTCGRVVKVGLSFCTGCGARHDVDSIKQKLNVCNVCGTEIGAGMAFCKRCGQPVAPESTNPNVCKTCGKTVKAGLFFCTGCGARLDVDSIKQKLNVCNVCGTEIGAGVAFCKRCGQPVMSESPRYSSTEPLGTYTTRSQPPMQPTVYPYSSPNVQKHSRRPLVAVISVFVAAAILITGFWQPGFFLTGKSGGHIESATASTVVSPENPAAQIGDITVNFGNNLTAETELTIQTSALPASSDYINSIDAYNFTLEGQSKFTTLVDITIPNTAGSNETCYMAYYNEETGNWEQIPFEINGDEVAFSTRHFSQFALFKYDRNRYTGPLTPVVINYDDYRAKLKADEDELYSLVESYLEGEIGSSPSTNAALSFANDILSISGYSATNSNLSDEVKKALNERLIILSSAIVFLKIAYQWQAQDSYDKILQDNIFNLCELALGGAA